LCGRTAAEPFHPIPQSSIRTSANARGRAASEEPVTEHEVLRVLARIARTGKAGDRLRAAELIGKQLGMFRQEGDRGPTLEEMILEAERMRRERAGQPVNDFEVVSPKPAKDRP
jgi:hypothetical protein